MARRRGTAGHKTKVLTNAGSSQIVTPTPEVLNTWRKFTTVMQSYLTVLFSSMSGNYVVIITLIVVLLLSFLLPDISQKAQAANELKNMRTVLNKISSEVKKAEVACLTVADDICYLHNTMLKDAKESTTKVPDLSFCTSHYLRTTQSEPAKFEKKIGFFRRNLHPTKNISTKEIAIMSYVYTDSFDDKGQTINISE